MFLLSANIRTLRKSSSLLDCSFVLRRLLRLEYGWVSYSAVSLVSCLTERRSSFAGLQTSGSITSLRIRSTFDLSTMHRSSLGCWNLTLGGSASS